MSSSIFFRFKSQKDPLQITFDGTSLSVFEVKRDIIALSKLGDGTDFDLEIYSADNSTESEYPLRCVYPAMLTLAQDTKMTRHKYLDLLQLSLAGCRPQDQVLARLHAMSQARCP